MAKVIGIDLGTTNSVVSTIDADGRPRIITSKQGDTVVPSIVGFKRDSEVPLVGMPAQRQAVTSPEDTFYAVKRLIGRRFDDPEFDGSDLNLAGWAKKISGLPTITVGSVGLDSDFLQSYGGGETHKAGIDALIRRLERDVRTAAASHVDVLGFRNAVAAPGASEN